MVEEHGCTPPEWYWQNLLVSMPMTAPHLGEYAVHDTGKKTSLRSALSEADYMTHLERNGDVVRVAFYVPLLAKVRQTQWNPDLIYVVSRTINYYVQQMFILKIRVTAI